MDAFAVAIVSSIALGAVTRRQVFRLAFHFGLFQAMMPAIGWMAGRGVKTWIEAWDHWVAFGLLFFIGAKGILKACFGTPEGQIDSDPTRGLRLVALSTATSIDALAVGLSFAALDIEILYPALVIGLVTGALTVVGMLLGAKLGMRFGQRLEILGGCLLIGIGVRILISHLT